MLTYVSRSLKGLLDLALGRGTGPHLRALPGRAEFYPDLRKLPARPSRGYLRLAAPSDHPDIPVAPMQVGASAFVAGQGARIYSLDAFRPRHGPGNPRAA